MFKYIDQFGQPFRLNFNKSQKTRTTMGSILTLIYISVILCIFWFIGTDLFYHRRPRIMSSTMKRGNNASPFRGAFGYSVQSGERILENFWQYIESKLTIEASSYKFELHLSLNKTEIAYDQSKFK
jgi:hypothetical protein